MTKENITFRFRWRVSSCQLFAAHLTHTSGGVVKVFQIAHPGYSCHFRLQGRCTYLVVLTFFKNNITDYIACSLSPCLFFQTSKRRIILSLCHVCITRKLLSILRTWRRKIYFVSGDACPAVSYLQPISHTHVWRCSEGVSNRPFRNQLPSAVCRVRVFVIFSAQTFLAMLAASFIPM